MNLYEYVFFIVNHLLGVFNATATSRLDSMYLLPLKPSDNLGSMWWNSTDTLFDVLNSLDFSQNMWSLFKLPNVFVSWLVYLLCGLITVELCLIMPFRWFKRLIQYPDHKLLTPNEYKRSKRK